MSKRKNDDIEGNVKKRNHGQKPTIPIQRGKFKNRYLRKHASLLHRMDDPANGLLITTDVGFETRALGQIRTFLENWTIKLFPDIKPKWPERKRNLDIDLEIVGIKQEQQQESENEKLFENVDSACSGLVMIRFRIDKTANEWIDKFFNEFSLLQEEEQQIIRKQLSYCHRLVPIDSVCVASLPDIKSLVESQFINQLNPNESVALLIEMRNNKSFTKQQLIQEIAPLIPPNLKIDLDKPKQVILISTFKSCTAVSYLKGYYERNKNNIQQFRNCKNE